MNDKSNYNDFLALVNKKLNIFMTNFDIDSILLQSFICIIGYSDNCFIKIDDQHLIINIDNDDDYLYQVTDYIRNRVNEILIKFKYAKYFRKPMVDFDYSHNNNYYKASLFLHVKTNHKKIIRLNNELLIEIYKAHALNNVGEMKIINLHLADYTEPMFIRAFFESKKYKLMSLQQEDGNIDKYTFQKTN